MYISYEWLQSFFDEEIPPIDEVARLLTAHSYEVEKVSDGVILIDVLPNRGHDSLCHLGVARELSVLLGRQVRSPLDSPNFITNNTRTAQRISLIIPDDGLVRRASKRIIADVKIGESPSWMRERLEKVEQRAINNIVDATNYVTFEIGQPVHAFDFDKIAGTEPKNIYIRYAKEGEKITLLDGNEYELDPSMLVIADDAGALDVAGIKGGARAAIDESTKTVLLSVCNFDPTNIRKTCEKLKINTDAAKRFKQELTPQLVEAGIERLTELAVTVAGGAPSVDVLDIYPEKPAITELTVTPREINALLGTTLSAGDIEAVLKRMEYAGFFYRVDNGAFRVRVPDERLDLTNPGRGEYSGANSADLIEEICRIVGYDTIVGVLPERLHAPAILKSYYYTELIRQTLIALGFSEVYTYSFLNDAAYLTDSSVFEAIKVENPIAVDKGCLRASLAYMMREKLDENLRNADLLGIDMVKIFEIGNVFRKKKQNDIEEYQEWVSLAISVKNKKDYDSADISQTIQHLAIALNTDVNYINSKSIWHYGNKAGGGICEINFTDLIEKLPEPKSYNALSEVPASRVVYTPIIPYPFITRDIAVWMPESADPSALEGIINTYGTELLRRVTLFDSFTKDGRTSYAYRLVFQASNRTLIDDEVNAIMNTIYSHAATQTGWEVR